MNKILMIILALGVTVGASAQPKLGRTARQQATIRGGGRTNTKSNVTVVVPSYGYNPYFGGLGYRNYFGYGLGMGYSPFYDPYYRYDRREDRPTQLDLAIEDIKEEFDYKIDSVKDDKTLSKDERKQKIRDLKHQKEDAIIEAKKSYYREKDQAEQEQE